MQLGAFKDATMNFVPVLYPLGDLSMIFFKLSTDFVHLGKEFTPGMDNLEIFHPSELHEAQSWSFGPLKHHHN